MSAVETFAVKKGVPIRRPRSSYPFESMEIGDCFDAPDNMGTVEGYLSKSSRRHSILASARNYKARVAHPTFKVTTALIVEGEQTIVRCWRVA